MRADENAASDAEAGATFGPAFLDYEAVIEMIGIAKSKKTLLRWEKDGCFPKRVWLGGATKAWPAPEVRKWCKARREGRRYVAEAP